MKIWNLTPKGPYAEWQPDLAFSGPITCLAHPHHERGGPRVENLKVQVAGPVTDFVWTWYSESLVTDRVLKVFEAARFSGFSTRVAEVRAKVPGHPIPQLSELNVHGWGGIASLSSGIELNEVESCPVCGFLVYTGLTRPELMFNVLDWDGSDLFMIWPLPRFIFATDRVAEVIRNERLTGVTLTEVKDMEAMRDGFAPGRLSDWMSRDRAITLGGDLGIA